MKELRILTLVFKNSESEDQEVHFIFHPQALLKEYFLKVNNILMVNVTNGHGVRDGNEALTSAVNNEIKLLLFNYIKQLYTNQNSDNNSNYSNCNNENDPPKMIPKIVLDQHFVATPEGTQYCLPSVTVFGFLLDYPIVYWLEEFNAQHCLNHLPLCLYQVILRVRLFHG